MEQGILKREDRKAAVAAYRDRKVVAGVDLVRCATTGQQWAGSAPNLATIWNRLSFTLRQGADPHRSLQTAWRDYGAGVSHSRSLNGWMSRRLSMGVSAP